MSSNRPLGSSSRPWKRTLELVAFIFLVALGATTIATTAWARDYAAPRATLLGSDRGVSLLVTAGAARVLIVNGTDPSSLGNALSRARHPGLDRLDLMIVSGNEAAAQLAPRAIELLSPRVVMTVGSSASLSESSYAATRIIQHPTVIELPDGVTITIEVWPAAGGENDDVTWSARIDRGDASIFWVSDREDLLQDSMPGEVDVTVIGRGAPAADSPLPNSRVIVAAGESISGPDLRSIVLDTIGPGAQTLRVFAGEITRVDLDLEGIRSVSGANPVATPIAA